MTNEEIRIAVAEEMGWKQIYEEEPMEGFVVLQGIKPDVGVMGVPDYPNSLDACAEFRGTLNPFELEKYAKHLWLILERDWTPKCWDSFTTLGQNYAMCDAKAVQHCEALLRLRGKWKD